MGFRFWKRIKIAPGVTVNLTQTGPSVSVGPRGAKVTIGKRGARASVGIPGTGLFYSTGMPARKPKSASGGRKGKRLPAPAGALPDASAVPENERALIAGCRELAAGNQDAALAHLRQATHLADGLCLAGFVALERDAPDEAARHLAAALERSQELGQGLGKYGVKPEVELTVTEEVSARIGPDERGALLALTEAYQRQERWAEAIGCLERLGRLEPEDVVVKLSLAELLLEHKPGDEQASRQALDLTQGVENESPVHTALLLYKARALRGLGLPDAAQAVLAEALRRKKGRPDELLAGLHYERALLLEAAGQEKRASAELQKAYALAPDYEDVAARLGL